MISPKSAKIVLLTTVVFVAARLMRLMAMRIKDSWYEHLQKPDFVVSETGVTIFWGISLFSFSIATALIWDKLACKKTKMQRLMALYLFFLFLCVIRPIVYLYLQSLELAVVNILLLLFLGMYLYTYYTQISEKIAYLTLPILLWLVYVSSVNITVWMVN